MTVGLLDRLIRQAGVDNLLEVLTERLSPSDLQSLMLEVYARVAGKVTPKRLLEQHERDWFVRPAAVDPRVLGDVERVAWSLLPPGYRPIELGPVCPLGTSSVVGPVHQNKIVSTIRQSEVVSDATNAMALECAVRRRAEPSRSVLLATSHRLIRAQGKPGPMVWGHFRLICLCAAGRDPGSSGFELENTREQLGFHLGLLGALIEQGSPLKNPRIALSDFSPGGRLQRGLEERILSPLRQQFPGATLGLYPEREAGRGYYESLCFKIYVTDADGNELEVGDGGDVPWTQTLLSNAKERLVISAIAQERLAALGPVVSARSSVRP